MEKPKINKPEVAVEDILAAEADAIVIIPGVALAGEDLSALVMKKADVSETPECDVGEAAALSAGGLNAKWLIVGRALPLDGGDRELVSFISAMRACVERARELNAETAAFASFPAEEYGSRLFSVLTSVWRAIMDSQREYDSPKHPRIICQNDEIARYYRVVYNYWYAIDKEDRLEDEHWD